MLMMIKGGLGPLRWGAQICDTKPTTTNCMHSHHGVQFEGEHGQLKLHGGQLVLAIIQIAEIRPRVVHEPDNVLQGQRVEHRRDPAPTSRRGRFPKRCVLCTLSK